MIGVERGWIILDSFSDLERQVNEGFKPGQPVCQPKFSPGIRPSKSLNSLYGSIFFLGGGVDGKEREREGFVSGNKKHL